VQNSAFMKD